MAAAGGCACVVAGLRCLRGMRVAGSLTTVPRCSFFLWECAWRDSSCWLGLGLCPKSSGAEATSCAEKTSDP